ncbi:hypothetical protein BGZ76_000640 [Entomortierella beljakovae]|nr:hypothetical protein BGZ76_000640 [Entomortierella beljakovae]
MDRLTQIASHARDAANVLQTLNTSQKSAFLNAIHQKLALAKDQILASNKLDKDLARPLVESGKLSASLFKRLDLEGPGKFETMLEGIKDIEKLDDPVNKVLMANKLDTGLDLYRVSCPVGVLLVIFEARPEVVANIAALALKSGNSAILKGGKESYHTCEAVSKAIQEAMAEVASTIVEGDDKNAADNLKNAVQVVESREDIDGLLKQDKYIDLVIPRGSNSLVKYIQWNTRIPVLGHADGLCSTYVAASAKIDLAKKVVVDAKTSYPAACNSTETLIVHSSHVDNNSEFFPQLAKVLVVDNGITIKCDKKSLASLEQDSVKEWFKDHQDKIQASIDEDYDTEFLDLILAVKTVDSTEEAVKHINEHGSKHTDAILTEDEAEAKRFMAGVDAAGVYWNASTRFADGFRYGFGAEVGVSTNKTHARGPVGLEGLVIYKYQLFGQGQATKDYGSVEDGKKRFLHERIEEVLKKYAKYAQSLSIFSLRDDPPADSLKNLKTIQFPSQPIPPSMQNGLLELILHNPQLTKVKINTTECSYPWEFLEALSRCQHLRILEFTTDNLDQRSAEFLFTTCARLEELRLTVSEYNGASWSLAKWAEFPMMRSLNLGDSLTQIPDDLQDVIGKCTQLYSLNIIIGPKKIPTRVLSQVLAVNCPRVKKLFLEQAFQTESEDADLSCILSSCSNLEALTLLKTGLPPMAFKSLTRHFDTLEYLNISNSPNMESWMTLTILKSCPRLKTLSAIRLDARDILGVAQPENEELRPMDWVCLNLTSFSVQICGLKGTPPSWQLKVLQQFSKLKKLRILNFDSRGAIGNDEGINLRVRDGLDTLKGLRDLEQLSFIGTKQEMEELDLRWMLEAWPKLKLIRGRVHHSRPVRTELHKILQGRCALMTFV